MATKTTKKTTKKPAAKKPAAKKVAPKQDKVTVEALQARVEKLEQENLVEQLKRACCRGVKFVQDKYEENPALTVGVGIGIFVLLLIIF